jgi:transcriptional regulator with XRE-family HTH domain
MDNTSFSKWLVAELKARKVTQAELAERLHTSDSHVSYVLSGRRNLSADFVISVAKALGVPVVPILELASIIPPQPQPDDPEAKRLLEVWYRLPEDERRVLLALLERASRH